MNWNDLPVTVLDTMACVGQFEPTDDQTARQLKGYFTANNRQHDWFMSAEDLREFARHFDMVANWLDERAEISLRVHRIKQLIETYSNDPECGLTDLLADLMHYASEQGDRVFEFALDSADKHFNAERRGKQ